MAADSVTLQHLVDAEDVDGVLALVSTDEIAEAYCQWQVRTASGEIPSLKDRSDWYATDPHWWAVEFRSMRSVSKREDLVRDLLVKFVDHAPSDDVLGAIGAGPFEEFITADEDRIRWIEQQAGASQPFRRALANVWIWGSEPDWVCERVESAAGVPLARPRRHWFVLALSDLVRAGYRNLRRKPKNEPG